MSFVYQLLCIFLCNIIKAIYEFLIPV